MTQRIAIETPHGTVYLGEACEKFKNKEWLRELFSMIRMNSGTVELSWGTGIMWYGLNCIRPIQPKKTRNMNKSELVRLVLKGAEFYGPQSPNGLAFPSLSGTNESPLIDSRGISEWRFYKLPGDPTERKLEVEE